MWVRVVVWFGCLVVVGTFHGVLRVAEQEGNAEVIGVAPTRNAHREFGCLFRLHIANAHRNRRVGDHKVRGTGQPS